MALILAADIGGTNSRFACFTADPGGALALRGVARLKTGQADSFAGLLAALWQGEFAPGPQEFDLAVLAVAGPVQGGSYSRPPNIAWDIRAADAEKAGLARCLLVNDFVAQAFGCRTDAVREARVVQAGRADPAAALAVIGAGTGLGHCALVPHGAGFAPVPSEAGHAAFPLYGEAEERFARFLRERTGKPYPYGDLVVSGPGLSLLHEFLTGERLPAREIDRRLTPESETLVWFARLYGRACRNYALSVLALGGLFVSGGVAAKNPGLVDNPHFLAEFCDSASHGALLREIPVRLNLNEDLGLYGAALCGRLSLEGRR
jgi:glucokinase